MAEAQTDVVCLCKVARPGGDVSCDSSPSSAQPNVHHFHLIGLQRKGAQQVTQEFDALLVCNGHYTEARWPEVAGQAAFPGRISHSHNYREPGSYAGQRVVCVGASASGTDISREIASVADQVGASSYQGGNAVLHQILGS